MTQSDVDRVKMAIGNCVRLIHDIAHGCNADLTAHPERVAVLAPPASHTVCSAMIAFLRLRRLGELPTDGPSFLTEAFKSIEIIGRRWGIARESSPFIPAAPVAFAVLNCR